MNMEIGLHKMQPSSGPDKGNNVLFLDFSSSSDVAFRILASMGLYLGFNRMFGIAKA